MSYEEAGAFGSAQGPFDFGVHLDACPGGDVVDVTKMAGTALGRLEERGDKAGGELEIVGHGRHYYPVLHKAGNVWLGGARVGILFLRRDALERPVRSQCFMAVLL